MGVANGRPAWSGEAATFVVLIIGVAAVVAVFALVPPGTVSVSISGSTETGTHPGLSSFQSYSQLQEYMVANAKSAQQYNRWGVGFGGWVPVGLPVAFGTTITMTQAATMTESTTTSSNVPSYTGTNVQVQGVDELDRVKTDGTHLFVSTQDSVALINAYPPNSTAILSTLSFPNEEVLGIETIQDRLMVILQTASGVGAVELLLYDTASLASPVLMQNVTIGGSYVGARMADDYLYAIIQQPSYTFNDQGNASAAEPMVSHNGVPGELPPSSVYYTNNTAQISFYTMIPSISMSTGNESVVSVLTGPSATIYVSTSNIYVAYTNYLDLYDVDGVPGNAWSGGVISPQMVMQSQNSTVLRAAYSNGTVTVAKAGVVPGTVLNQFSMDEYNGYFRVATSRFTMINGVATTSDDVYVLDQNMNQVSALKNIAPGENIYAVRFDGDVGYVVTYQQIDPLFVISFKDIAKPVILSALKVTGYSDYLQPLAGGYLLGIGKESVPASNGNFSYYLGLKISLFKVDENGSSTQVAKLDIGDRGTDSPVLSDHLAFTYDPTKNITVIPLTLYLVSGNQTYEGGIPAFGDPVWQGVYVIKVNSAGLDVLGKVSQYPAGQNVGDYPNASLSIDRSVIIGDYLYTVSQSEVMVSSMISGFSTVATVQLPS
ncbi:MAG TPA: beta-propeller domain-containing protein [Nitrososphaerales archaeon]|nr:beta-propeller domain-containing protein [Nitrososphaerales archaeon]